MRIFRGNEEAIDAVVDGFVDSTDISGKDGKTLPHGFKDADGKGFPVGGKDKDIAFGEEGRDIGALLEKLNTVSKVVGGGGALHGGQERARPGEAQLPVEMRQLASAWRRVS